jgi:glycosyltransferase involved in cell wall biosynthesis
MKRGKGKMRISLVTYRYGREVMGGGEKYLRELMTRLARKGHQVEVHTTRSRFMLASPLGYLLWDNLLPGGRRVEEGVEVFRYPVRNPAPRRAGRKWEKLLELQRREREEDAFFLSLAEAVDGKKEHCFLCGWHPCEEWEDGPARWSADRARLVAGGEDIEAVTMEAAVYLDGMLRVKVEGKGIWEFELEKGKPRELLLRFPPGGAVAMTLEVSRAGRPPGDARLLGAALRKVTVVEGSGARDLCLGRDWNDFLETAPEEVVGRVLWEAAARRKERYSRWHRYVMGPRSPELEKGAAEAAARSDVVLGSMVPVVTLETAWKAARKAGKPFVALPLFHSRDPNHYWSHFHQALAGAAGVEAGLESICELMRGWGFRPFAVGPGFNLEEFSSGGMEGEEFRSRYNLEGKPMLLWVGRKNLYKGYREAMETLRWVRRKGIPAVLVMAGPEEDHLPVSAEGVYYLGALPRRELLGAYEACDVFVFPSLHESFCLVFGEAWLKGKPVLGNAYCAAARGLIENGVDGYLCRGVEEFGRRAEELLRDPEKARRMGEHGRRKITAARGWDVLVDKMERELEDIVETGTRGSAPGSKI